MTITLLEHQLKWAEICKRHPRYGWWASPGVGKTIGTLAAIDAAPMRTVVLAPKSVVSTAWLRDCGHFPAIKAAVLTADTPKRVTLARSGQWDVCVTNYAMFTKHADDFKANGVRRLVVDESSKIRTPETQITEACIAFADSMDDVRCLSGTPAPNNYTEYWGQLRTISSAAVEYANYWKFAHKYGTPIKRTVYTARGKKEVVSGWHQTDAQRRALAELLNKWSWTLHKNDCLNLPRKHDIIIPIVLGDEQQAYDDAESAMKIEHRGESHRLNPNAVTMKIRQITGGSVRLGTDGHVVDIGRSKIDALDDLLDSLGPSEPVIVWAEFTHEIDRIADLIRARGESVEVIDGRTSGKAAQFAERFQAGAIKRLVCHPAAAGHGITLTAAAYAVYFSLSFSYEQYDQSRDRIHRVGQSRPCTYYHLIAVDTVDQVCLRVVQRKESVAAALRVLLGEVRADDDL